MKHAVLLGDSIFDNGSYVPGQPSVIEQVGQHLGNTWKVTLLAIDGNFTDDVKNQIRDIPDGATHLVISVGGNDALETSIILYEPVGSVAEALTSLAKARFKFQSAYNKMLKNVLRLNLPTAVCTIYDSVPDLDRIAVTALSVFNDVIIKEAISFGVPIIDLRFTCSEDKEYSSLSSIEPSAIGGEKIANAIYKLLNNYNFKDRHTSVFF